MKIGKQLGKHWKSFHKIDDVDEFDHFNKFNHQLSQVWSY